MSQKNKHQLPTIKARILALKYLPLFLKEIWHTQPWMTATNVVLRLIRSVIPFLTLYLGKLIIDEVVLLINSHSTDTRHLLALIGMELALAMSSDILNRMTGLLDGLLGDLHANRSSIQIMQHAATLDLTQFEEPIFYDKLERARQQTVGRTALLAQTLAQVQDIITIGFLAGGLAVFSPWLILILVLSIIPGFFGEFYFNSQSYALSYQWTPQRRELDYIRYIGASNVYAKEMKLFSLSGFLTERFREVSAAYYLQNRKLAIRRAVWGALLAAVGTAGYYGAYAFIGIETIKGVITIGSLTFLAGSFRQLKASLEGILNRFTTISQGTLYLRDFFEFFDLRPEVISPPKPLPFPSVIQKGFVFENVSFKYPGAERWVFQNLNFTLKAGEKLAIVGENGAGKTTLVKLLTRLYDPTEGRILLEGRDLREYELGELQRHIGVIFQDYIRLMMTAQSNIAVGDIDELNNLDRIATAADRSLASALIKRFPDGLQQVLGRHFSGGVELSGGEWQKIALARAYMRDSDLLILDEPTAALDARAEYEVFQRFAELTKGKMALLISHRFSTVRMADRIIVIENGQLIESGSHQSLMDNKGRYAELFQLQARGYL
ncbi:ABC transporter ATP-binding protein [Runella aurantiaca]|uniref:ABC transporter ATP-binding protein n=1 Tax=Runella aurantiaca TaxID=2282308 RepID=A0A369I3I0_9BACT|nr:ABC transporter ATP-binding protein [Runella aurantiaca]RDB03470.1 ABC transporter ATP-binding protein [Runella aurantiaca]